MFNVPRPIFEGDDARFLRLLMLAMNSPFGRLSLWIIIAIAVLLLGGCMQPMNRSARLGPPQKQSVEPSFNLLPVPRKELIPASYVPQTTQEIPPPVIVPPPETDPAPNSVQPSGRTAVGPLRWRSPSRQRHEPPLAHHPAYPHRR